MPNLLENRYNSLSTNYVLCLDVTSLGAHGELLLIVCLSSRCIVGHCFKNAPITKDDVCLTVEKVINSRSFLPQIHIIHSDRGYIFKNSSYISLIESYGSLVSRGSSSGHQNQVVERLNRTIKDYLCSFLDPGFYSYSPAEKKANNPLLTDNLDTQRLSDLIQDTIEFYNNKSHRSLQKRSPNFMEEAFFASNGHEHPSDVQILSSKVDDSLVGFTEVQSAVIVKYEDDLFNELQKYGGSWPRFFVDWRKKQEESTAKLLSRLDDADLRYKSLYEKHMEIHKELLLLRESRDAEAALIAEKQAKSVHRRKSKGILAIRDAITPKEFSIILELINQRSFVGSRRRLVFVILYLTGLRISNLLTFSIFNVEELLISGSTLISINKGGPSRFNLLLTNQGVKFLRKFRKDFDLVKGNRSSDLPFFCSHSDGSRSLSRVFLNRDVNLILKKASVQLGKNIRSHSFRASIITDLLVDTPIDQVKEVIGHRSISTTLEYKRGHLSKRDVKSILKNRKLPSL